MEHRPDYPIYIISKGRAYNPLTAKMFDRALLDYKIVIEPQEYLEYSKVIDKNKIITLPFSNLGLGSYPARNFCWLDSIEKGYERHWIFDDNIWNIRCWIDGKKRVVKNVEEALIYVEKHAKKNDIDISGFEYSTFVQKPPPRAFKLNTKVFSAILIKNNIPYRWRLKYNEDIDLCLQVLHNGGKTACCTYYITDKTSTSSKMKGGNQEELYKNNDPAKKLLKVKMLEKVWPQYVKTVIRYGRYHHLIDWKRFNKKQYKNNALPTLQTR